MFKHLIAVLLFIPLTAFGQSPSFTANNVVPPYTGDFGYGVNLGYYPPYYYDKELAALAAGTPDGKVPGFGITTIRPGLFEHFLDYWGYDIRVDHFRYYDTLGLKDNVVILGFPSDRHRDPSYYCPNIQSEVFKGMYEPIWDNGQNGTPINENNTYAYYVWKTATTYKDQIKFWEVWNEPDVDFSGNGWAPKGYPGNWWENAPGPCETKMRAPFYYYVRLLRISYEVIKAVDPTDYVCVGGLGNPSYLGAILKWTDNPFDGSPNGKYPLTGGAYFDCMSFHSYPHIDNSMRWWDNAISGFAYNRHSDAALDGLWRLKDRFVDALYEAGYNGVKYPKKVVICTEFNLPRKQYDEYLGSDAAQCNFVIKALVTAQMEEEVAQMHLYCLADEKPENEATGEFAFMGLVKNLNNAVPYNAEPNAVAWAVKSTSMFLKGKRYDKTRTEQLKLPANIRGGAFRDKTTGRYSYILWAVTERDRDETATAEYSFPPQLITSGKVEIKDWDFSRTGVHYFVNSSQMNLTGHPVFLEETYLTNKVIKQPEVYPNPLEVGRGVYSFYLYEDAKVTAEIFDPRGALVATLFEDQNLVQGAHEFPLDLNKLRNGIYYVRLTTPENTITKSFMKY